MNKNLLNRQFFKVKGFTIMEIVVSIYIISIGLVGIYSLISQNIKAQYLNKNTLIASQLAQEGIELTRNIRDKNWITYDINGDPLPFYNIIGNIDGTKTFNIDYKDSNSDGIPDIESISGIDQDPGAKLYIDDSTGFYTKDSTAPNQKSIFNRMIVTTHNGTSSSTVVECTIKWKEKNIDQLYKVNAILYDWR